MRRWTGLRPSAKFGNGAVADDVGGVIKKTAIHAPVQLDVHITVDFFLRFWRGLRRLLLRQVSFFVFRCHG
jgi:hypothetical protein